MNPEIMKSSKRDNKISCLTKCTEVRGLENTETHKGTGKMRQTRKSYIRS